MTIPKNVQKAFAVSNILHRVIVLMETDNVDIHKLEIRTKNAVSVFARKASFEAKLIDGEITSIWTKLAKDHSNSLNMRELEVYVEYLCMLIRPNDFYEYLKVKPFTTEYVVTNEKDRTITSAILSLDKELNRFFDIKPYALTKPKEKVKKEKKARDKKATVNVVKEKSNKALKAIAKRKERKEMKMKKLSRLREIARLARERVGDEVL